MSRDTDPPRVRKVEAMSISVGHAPKHIGYLGEVPTDGYPRWAYVTRAASDDYLANFRPDAGGAYAVSVHALTTVEGVAKRHGASRPETVFIEDADAGDVYEYDAIALFDGPRVPDRFLESASNPKKYVTRDGARHVWRAHAADGFYITRGDDHDLRA